MLIKFPQISKNNTDQSFIVHGDTAFAKHNIVTESSGKQVGFLTEHSLMFIIQGKKYFHFDGHNVCIHSHELILVKRGIYSISEFIPDDGCFEALILFIPDKFLKTLYKPSVASEKTPETPYAVLPCNKLLEQFRSQYLNYFIGDFPGKEQLLNLKLQELFLLLKHSASHAEVDNFISSCLNKASIDIEYIVKSHLFQPLSIQDYAKLCMRSPASFKRDFKTRFNTSPKQWINQQRILHAASLLNSTDKTISEIAHECGFENTSHFTKLFKNQMGFTPKKGRAKIARI